MSFVPSSFLPASFAPVCHLGASPTALAIGFSVLLVLSLVTAEELEIRRNQTSGLTGQAESSSLLADRT